MKLIDDDGNVIAEGQVLDMKPGDVLVLQAEGFLSEDERVRVRAMLEDAFPDTKVVGLHGGAELSVLRPAEVATA